MTSHVELSKTHLSSNHSHLNISFLTKLLFGFACLLFVSPEAFAAAVCYPALNAMSGSTRVTLRAAMNAATSPVTRSVNATAA